MSFPPTNIKRSVRLTKTRSLAHASWPRFHAHLITAIIAKIPARVHDASRCFNHRFNGAFAVHLLADVWKPRGEGGRDRASSPRSRIAYPRLSTFFFFFAATYLRGLVTRRYYSGIHVPADRENCDYLQRLELFLAIRSRDTNSTLAQ